MDPNLEQQIEDLHEASFAWTLTCCGGDRQEAEDVLQTTYLKVLDGRARFNGRSSLKTWLFAVIRRTAVGRRRQAWWRGVLLDRRQAEEIEVLESTPEEEMRQSQRGARVRQALVELPPRQRQVLELVFFHDLSIRQAAGVLAISLGTARVHYQRGKQALAGFLTGERSFEEVPDAARV